MGGAGGRCGAAARIGGLPSPEGPRHVPRQECAAFRCAWLPTTFTRCSPLFKAALIPQKCAFAVYTTLPVISLTLLPSKAKRGVLNITLNHSPHTAAGGFEVYGTLMARPEAAAALGHV